MAKRKKEPYVPNTGILGNAIDYNYFYMSILVRIACFIVGMIIGFSVGYIFYESIFLSLIAGTVCGVVAQPIYHNYFIQKRKKDLTIQFKDMLESLSTSIGAGSNVQDAFQSAYKDMCVQYTEDSYIAREVWLINSGLYNNISIESLLVDFGERSGVGDIKNFANVFDTCYRKGGNIKDVIKNTYQIISDKIEIELEIKTVVASKTSEQNIMLVMPVLLVIMLKSMAGDVVNLNTAVGRLSTTFAIIICGIAYMISRKILSIKV